MCIDEGLNRGFELRDAAKGAAAELLGRQQSEPAFDQTQPRGISRGEVDVESGALGEPVPDQWRFVGAVVVHDDVHVEFARDLRLDEIEKFAELRRAMPLMKLSDHFTGLRIQRRKQGRRSMALVVVCPPFDLPGLQRQQRLRAIERLNLRLLIHAEDRGMRGRIQIQPDDVPDLFDQQRIVRQFERLAPVRLQPERLPNPVDGHATQPDGPRHVAGTPVRRASRRRFQCPDDHFLDLIIGHRPRRAGPRFVIQAVQSLPDEAPSPFAHCRGCDVESPRDHLAVGAIGTRQDDACPPCHVWRRSRAMCQRIQSSTFVLRQDQCNLGASRSHARLLVEQYRAGRAICFSFYRDRTLGEKPSRESDPVLSV